MLNWIVWNRTVFDIGTALMLNWIVWNRTVYMYKLDFGINNLQWLMCHKTKPNETKKQRQMYMYVCMYVYVCNKNYFKQKYKQLRCGKLTTLVLSEWTLTIRHQELPPLFFFGSNSKTSMCTQTPTCEPVKKIASRKVFVTRSFNRLKVTKLAKSYPKFN